MDHEDVECSLFSGVATPQSADGDIDHVALRGAVVRASLALLTPEQIADVVTSRAVIERAKGFLMQVYDMDAEDAVELLRWWSQGTAVTLGVLARQLIDHLAGRMQDDLASLRSACDELLFAGHDDGRAAPREVENRSGPRPPTQTTLSGGQR